MLVAAATVPFGLVGVLIVVGFLIWLLRTRSPMVTRECPHCRSGFAVTRVCARTVSASRLPGLSMRAAGRQNGERGASD